MDRFTEAYNHQHHHSGIGLRTPADVHYGHAATVTGQRSADPAAARLAPRAAATTHDPKILALSDAAWIDQPAADRQLLNTHWPRRP
jgi:putative transposase